MADAYLALWWVPAGVVPTVADAEERIDRLRRLGPGPHAFDFCQVFPPPGAGAPDDSTDWKSCPAA